MSDGMVRKWLRMFNEGRENLHDEAWSERPSLVNDDLVRKVNERVRDDRRFTISDLSLHFPQISRTLLYDIVSSHLGYRKVCAWWVPKMLTEEHKKQRVACALTFLMCYHNEGDSMLSHIDRRWDMGFPYHTWIKTAVPALEAYWLSEKEKVQADDFNKEDHVHRILGVLLVEFLPQGKTINCCLLWNAEEAEACNSKQKARNAVCHHSFASR